MATLANALTAVVDRLDITASETAGQWTSPKLRRWIQEGMRDIARRTECLETTASVTTVAGTQTYTLTQDIVRIHRVEYNPTGESRKIPLEIRDLHAMDQAWGTQQSISTGDPVIVTFWGYAPSTAMKVYPTPSRAGTFLVWYYKFPTALLTDGTQDSSTLDLPTGWEDLAADYAFAQALRADRDPRWQEVIAHYEQRVLDILATVQHHHDGTGMFTTETGFLPGWLVNG